MTPLSTPTASVTDSPIGHSSSPSVGERECESLHDVGEILRSAEAELDRAIAELGRASERAMADGDPHGARLYSSRMYQAIASRTPEHRERLDREALQRITESNSQ